mmetsp:Transcript_28370/g.54044  ORF Transcript_28370/g.54044 Transcript_28370/m.54044 type:complete len:348 (+) Transcript_28370:214-1257(+)|eukprot:CAMPEP_0114236170 /NCGR_PEP_ID=MMETSP0058-20121206/6688_1 /TAXON_ID=36894 /ORGANISM="Pyramimonas parkeae, CCMP726" /LENGTH=347 /DNA_ID=CAMNT_0001348075 /DNA_START=590 /DNA_END=1633 /DNA_ORIENTATION=-
MAGMGINGGIVGAPTPPAGGMGAQFASMNGGDNIQSIMNGTYGKGMEQSFKEFCDRPENKPMIIKHQQSEVRKAMRLQRKMKAMEFKEKVMESDYDAQKNMAPFLENRVLRKIVQTFTNDPRNDFSKWANNPLVIRMLTKAKEMMDEGRMSEDEAEHLILKQLNDPNHISHHDFKLKTKQVVRLATDQLVPALNEQLQHRRKGNDLYKAKKFKQALKCYNDGISICNFVVGMSGPDQKEIDINKVACLLNIAACNIAMKDYGQAIRNSTEAVELDPLNVKALLRRAKAYIGRREYQSAKKDLDKVKDLEPWNWEAEEEERRMAKMKRKDLEKDKEFSKEIFTVPDEE